MSPAHTLQLDPLHLPSCRDPAHAAFRIPKRPVGTPWCTPATLRNYCPAPLSRQPTIEVPEREVGAQPRCNRAPRARPTSVPPHDPIHIDLCQRNRHCKPHCSDSHYMSRYLMPATPCSCRYRSWCPRCWSRWRCGQRPRPRSLREAVEQGQCPEMIPSVRLICCRPGTIGSRADNLDDEVHRVARPLSIFCRRPATQFK